MVEFETNVEKEVVSVRKASSVLIGFIFFVISISLLIISKELFLWAIVISLAGIIFLFTGISKVSYDERLSRDGTNLDNLNLRESWHMEMQMSIVISFFIGGFFFVSSIILFFLDSKKFFMSLLFCDIVGATILVYALQIQSYNKQVLSYEEKIDEIKERIAQKNWYYQDIN
ncbi:hypothetical protein JXM83_06260 [Candidatus Woesearchaeota archaeon]|nr:hypothetical protein [Candidatus Woesearchaeota archaeon]